jgi:RNA polymerase sigma-70 factor (ECF subfamily)
MFLVIALFSTIIGRSQRDEDDVLILKRIVNGEESAMAELYDRYCQLLYTFSVRILRSEEETQDLLQEVFLQAWNKASSYEKGKGTVYTWLVTMTRNRAIDLVRSKGFKQQSQNVDIENINLVADMRSSNPLAITVAGEDQRVVMNALKKLTADQQQIIALAYYEGYSQSEIAGKLNIPLGTVKSRMRKGLMEMRSVLQENK